LARRLLATDLSAEQRLLAEGIRDAADATLAKPSRAGRGRQPRGRGRILVVDDSESNRLLALLQLDRLGFDAVAVDSGWVALDRLAEEPFDLVLLDGMMPGLDGPGTAREIRRREASAGLLRMPIVALTASILPEDRALVLEAGMDDHLAKPIRIEELARVLDMRLAEAPSRRGGRLPPPDDVPLHTARTTDVSHTERHDGPDTVVDPAVFARLADIGDPRLTARLVRLFLADAAERVQQVDAALAADDTVRLRAALQALEGTCSGVGAVALLRRAHELHDAAVLMDREGRAAGPTGSGLSELLRETQGWFDKAVAQRA
jgi:two-component system sensor histidine kinase BarA